jgi:glycosyltransferase involved in cell wall biosynthesis
VNHHLCLDHLSTEVANTASERLSLNLPLSAFVVGSFGFMSSAKRLEVSLHAFARFQRRFPYAVYVLVGKILPSLDVDYLMENAGVEEDAVILTGYVDKETFLRYMATIDLALNLRFPTYGETSGAVIRLMGLGKPVIVSNAGSFAEYPDNSCVKIDVDETEEEILLAMMCALATDKELRTQIGTNAQKYVRTHHTLEESARGYIDFMREVVAAPPKVLAKVPPLSKPAEHDVLSDLIADVATELVDLGIDESDEEILSGVAQAIATLSGTP